MLFIMGFPGAAVEPHPCKGLSLEWQPDISPHRENQPALPALDGP